MAMDPRYADQMRGTELLNAGRPRDALPYLQAAVAADPESAHVYAELARCWIEIPGQRVKAISAIDRAIAVAPNQSYLHGRKGWYLVCLGRYRAALKTAKAGLAINPNCVFSLNALANAHTKLSQWSAAAKVCRRILELDPHDGPGLNLLAQALRYQGRWKESRETVERLLANIPNSAFGHNNAGYAALSAGDHLRANGHFLEALRLDPHFEQAKEGLLQSLNAHIWLNRFNRRVFSVLHVPSSPRNLLLLLLASGVAVALVLADIMAFPKTVGASLAVIFALLLVYTVLSVVIAIMGHFLLLFHPLIRHALSWRQKLRFFMLGAFFLYPIFLLVRGGLYAAALWTVAGLLLLAASIQLPLLWDSWVRRRMQRAED